MGWCIRRNAAGAKTLPPSDGKDGQYKITTEDILFAFASMNTAWGQRKSKATQYLNGQYNAEALLLTLTEKFDKSCKLFFIAEAFDIPIVVCLLAKLNMKDAAVQKFYN